MQMQIHRDAHTLNHAINPIHFYKYMQIINKICKYTHSVPNFKFKLQYKWKQNQNQKIKKDENQIAIYIIHTHRWQNIYNILYSMENQVE